jgi:hypothetical protein
MYDKFQRLAMESQMAVVILSDPTATDLEFVPVWPRAASDTHLDALAASGRPLEFLGVAGLVDGVTRTALAVPLDPTRIETVSLAFCRYCEGALSEAIEAKRMGDSLEFLGKLYRLEDTRPN